MPVNRHSIFYLRGVYVRAHMCMCVRTCVYTCHSAWRRSEDNAGKLVLSFYLPGSKDPTQVIRFGSEHLYSLNHLTHLTRV